MDKTEQTVVELTEAEIDAVAGGVGSRETDTGVIG